jgi:formamidopyrimidine-DNA glycosylase
MPELPEVQTVVNALLRSVLDRPIRHIELNRRDVVHPAQCDLVARLNGRSIRSVGRRGKRIVFTLDDGERFFIHLGMSGRLTLQSTDEPLAPHTHLKLTFDGGVQLRFVDPRRFGGIWWLDAAAADGGNMGPEPLGLRTKSLARRLAKTRRVIKTALMDQTLIAGLGNIYADESLFTARIHPLIPANELTIAQITDLSRAIKTVLRRALHHRGSTLRDYRNADGSAGDFQRLHRVYGREGLPCLRCKTPIVRVVVGGRSTHFCPRCQSK